MRHIVIHLPEENRSCPWVVIRPRPLHSCADRWHAVEIARRLDAGESPTLTDEELDAIKAAAIPDLWHYPCSTNEDDIADLLRALTTPPHGVNQREAARMLRIDDTTIRKWLAPAKASTHRDPPWAAVELLRRLVIERR